MRGNMDRKSHPMNEYHGFTELVSKYASELALVALAVLGATARFIAVPPRASLVAYLRGCFLAIFAVWTANYFANAAGASEQLKLGLLGVSAFLADDIVFGLVTVGQRIRTDPKGLIEDIKGLVGRRS